MEKAPVCSLDDCVVTFRVLKESTANANLSHEGEDHFHKKPFTEMLHSDTVGLRALCVNGGKSRTP